MRFDGAEIVGIIIGVWILIVVVLVAWQALQRARHRRLCKHAETPGAFGPNVKRAVQRRKRRK